MKFIPRYEAPEKNNKYYYEENEYYKRKYGMPNCTAYAYGRFNELLGQYTNKLYYGNAENWYVGTTAYEKGQTPKLGGIACWQKGKTWNESDGAGHVAIVEEIKGDGTIVTSNSAYKGTNFYMREIKPPYNYNSSYDFQGFIYLPIEFNEEPPSKVDFEVGMTVLLSKEATVYQGNDKGVKIPDSVKNKQYTIQEVSKDSLLLKEIFSWVLASECSLVTETKYISYTVKKGDTLWAISQKYNTTVDELVELNNIKNRDLIVVGQVLKIPA